MPTGQFGQDLAALRAQTQMRPIVNPGGSAGPMAKGKTSPPRPGVGEMAGDFATGVAKGVGSTAVGLGNLVHKTPVLGDLTDILARMTGGGDNPGNAFDAAQQQLTARPGTMEGTGKTAEQIAEFFTPVKGSGVLKVQTLPTAVRSALVKKMVPYLKNSPQLAGLVNKLAAVGGDAGTAMGLSAAHGGNEGDVAQAGTIAGVGAGALGPMAGGAARGATAFAATPIGRQVVPYLAALGTSAAGDFSSGGLGAGLGAFGLSRMLARRFLDARHITPAVAAKAGRTVQKGVETGARATAAIADTFRPSRRRLEQGQ